MFTVTKGELCEKLAIVKQVMNEKSQLESARGILFKDGRMTATNIEMYVQAPIDYSGDPFILPAKAVSMIDQMPEGMMEIDLKGKQIQISAFGISAKYQSIDADQFPTVPQFDANSTVTMDADVFRDAINGTLYLVDEKQSKMVHRGIKYENGEFAATEGVRLAVYTDEKLKEQELSCVLPKSAAQIALSALGKEKEIKLGVGKRHIQFKIGDISIISRALDGEFLNYHQLFKPAASSIKAKVSELRGCVSRCVATSEDNPPLIALEIGADELTITLVSTLNSYTESISIPRQEEPHGTARIGLNARKLLEVLRKQKAEDVVIEYGGPVQPVILKTESLMTMILPVRMKQ